MAEWRNKQGITQKLTTFIVCVLITAILLLMRSKFEQLPERNTHFQSQPNVSLEFQTFCPDVWKSHSVATGTPPAEEKNATTLKGHLLTYAGSRSRGEPMVLALLLTYSSWNRRDSAWRVGSKAQECCCDDRWWLPLWSASIFHVLSFPHLWVT